MQFQRLTLARLSFVAAMAGLAASYAHGHITLEQPSAEAGSTYKAVFRVGHGCDHAPTNGLTVFMPAGVENASPMPKPGWTVGVVDSVPSGAAPKQIHWRGGPLPSGFYDEFTVRLKLPQQQGPVWFRVLQECEGGGSIDWAETPTEGASAHGLKRPAAKLELRANEKAAPGTHHH